MEKTTANSPRLAWCWPVLWISPLFMLVGCVSDDPAPKAPPTANVTKIQAWHDAEMLSNRGPGRSAAAGAGSSMLPVYGDNTMLVISAVPYDALQAGMTVAYRNLRGDEVVHKLIEKTYRGWRVEGLNNDEPDPDLVTPENLIGVVYATLNYEDED
jgi:hypothetical protein